MPALFEAVKCNCKSCNKVIWGWFKNDEYENYECNDCKDFRNYLNYINNLTQRD